MKKRVLALLLCVCLVALMVPSLPARAATAADDARAYLKILDETNPTNSYLIDFDGDGRDELLTVMAVDPYRIEASYSVYQGDRALLLDERSMEVANLWSATICTKDGKHYICSSVFVYSTVENGKWVDAYGHYLYGEPVAGLGSDPQFTDEDIAAMEYIADGRRVTEDEYYREIKEFQDQFSVWDSGDVRPQLQKAVYATMSPAELLAEMAYAGDRSKCRMTARQAEAFADMLESELKRTEDEWEYYGKSVSAAYPYAVLFDTGAGIPAMLFDPVPFEDFADFCGVWEYQDGQVERTVGLPWDREISIFYDHLFYTARGAIGTSSCVFAFQNGRILPKAISTCAPSDAAWPDENGEFLYAVDGEPVLEEDVNAWFDKWNGDDYLYRGVRWGDDENKKRITGTEDARTMVTLLRAYASARRYPEYSYAALEAAGNEYAQVLAAVGIDRAVEVRRLAEGLYYVIYETDDGFAGALVRQGREKGQPVFRVERRDNAPVEQTELEPTVNEAMTKSNLNIDLGKITRGTTLEDVREYLTSLLENMDAPAPNDPAKSDLAAFLDSAAAALTTKAVEGKKNVLTLKEETVAELADGAKEVYNGLLEPLEDNGVTLNKTLTPIVRALWEDVETSEPCQIEVDRDAARALKGSALQVLLGKAHTYLRFTADDLTGLTRDMGGTLRVQFSKEEDGVYAIRFLNEDGEVVDRLSSPVTVSLPAGGELDTIMASYAGGSDNWGGQYDPATGAISFETRYSGQYEVLENKVAIDDIAELSDESRAAISFMVSKGYLSAEEGLFRPGEPLTRYEFTEALVGMFFALDRELTTDFPDVPKDSRYYPYVASAQASSIVNGYSDGTFSGDDPINREQVFALAARTLMEQKGYAQPSDSEVYLSSFGDRSELSEWAAPQVALSVREGIAGRGAILLPKANITREQAAVVLYRLFQLLYEVSPVALELPDSGGAADGGGLPLPAIIGLVAVAAAAAGGGLAAVALKKKKKTPVE